MKYWLPILVFSVLTIIGVTLFEVLGENKEISDNRIRGVSWVGGDSVSIINVKPLVANNVEWVVQTPFGWMDSVNSPQVKMANGEGYYWGESDRGIKHTANLTKQLGIKTILKPHIWLNPRKGKWRADIKMDSEQEWDQWFDSYENFILHYARLAEELGLEGLCLGTELYYPSTQRSEDFRQLIRKVREIYSGKLIYAANWYKEYEEIEFWDELDWIGVQAYFPLSQTESPGKEELLQNWKPFKESLRSVSEKYGKQVVFTEIGYKSTPDAAIEPWIWPRRGSSMEVSYETQSICYEALFNTFWNEPWFGGMFIWKWFPHSNKINAGGFTPQQKPAEKVIRDWYQRSSSRSSISMAD